MLRRQLRKVLFLVLIEVRSVKTECCNMVYSLRNVQFASMHVCIMQRVSHIEKHLSLMMVVVVVVVEEVCSFRQIC